MIPVMIDHDVTLVSDPTDEALDEYFELYDPIPPDPDLAAIRETPLYEGDHAEWHKGQPTDPTLYFKYFGSDGQKMAHYGHRHVFVVDGIVYDPSGTIPGATHQGSYGKEMLTIKGESEALTTGARDQWRYNPSLIPIFDETGDHSFIVKDPQDSDNSPLRSSP